MPIRYFKPDPQHAKRLVADMTDDQVVKMLTDMGSTTAASRPIRECRVFLAKYLGTLPREEEDIGKA